MTEAPRVATLPLLARSGRGACAPSLTGLSDRREHTSPGSGVHVGEKFERGVAQPPVRGGGRVRHLVRPPEPDCPRSRERCARVHTYICTFAVRHEGGDAIGPNSGSPSMARAEGMRVYVHTAGMPKAAPSKGRADRYSRVHALFQVSSRGRATVAGGGAMQTRF